MSLPPKLPDAIFNILDVWYQNGIVVGGVGSDTLENLIEISVNYISVIHRYFSIENDISIVDFGSGIGIPGLIMACFTPNWKYSLLDSMSRRTRVAEEAIIELALQEQVDVLLGRAEELVSPLRHSFDVVVARCFASPPLLMELCIPYVREGGLIVVSEPPSIATEVRWSASALGKLGLDYPQVFIESGRRYAAFVVRRSVALKPRSFAQIRKTPLWT